MSIKNVITIIIVFALGVTLSTLILTMAKHSVQNTQQTQSSFDTEIATVGKKEQQLAAQAQTSKIPPPPAASDSEDYNPIPAPYTYNGITISESAENDNNSATVYRTIGNGKPVQLVQVLATDGAPEIKKTTDPNVAYIYTSVGDGPGGPANEYYIQLSTGVVEYVQSEGYVAIQNESNNSTLTIDFQADESKCIDSVPQDQQKAYLSGILLNKQLYPFSKTLSFECANADPDYDPDDGYVPYYGSVSFLGFSHDFSEAYVNFSTLDSPSSVDLNYAVNLHTKTLVPLQQPPANLTVDIP